MIPEKEALLEYLQLLLPEDQSYLNQTGSSYLAEIRELESLLRPLWGLLPACSENLAELKNFDTFTKLQKCVEEQTLPKISTANRQIAVEIGVLSYGIGQFGKDFLALFSYSGQNYLISWLNQLNQIEFPAGNWYFFLILLNGALKEQGLTYSEERLDFAKAGIESFYLGEGWYSDGKNNQRDYYVAFAFHFYGLLYSRFSSDPQGEEYRQRAIAFAEDYYYWFDGEGRSLPFGRSLTYRFAHLSFWSALILSDAYKESALSLEAIKGIIGRNLRFWQKQPITLPKEKNLSIGYGYQNLLLSEDYNAPASPMWAFKAFVLLELPANHLFWQLPEEDYQEQALVVQPQPGFHLTQTKEQTIALSNLQYCQNQQLYHQSEKYTKFAYSSYFGFNLTRDNQEIEAFAIDSTLAFSVRGHQQYQTRRKNIATKTYPEYSVSRWSVWEELFVTTYLIPIDGNSHIRIHQIATPFAVEAIEGGFALHEWNKKYNQPQLQQRTALLENNHGYSLIKELQDQRQAGVVAQGPNSNLYSAEKNTIPVLTGMLTAGKYTLATFVSGAPHVSSIPEVRFKEQSDSYEIEVAAKKIKIMKERFL
ncbi:DUF2264 domain-containing protein [Enterococcus sp. DIV0800]|uniref:DUF2264 domain-containing protein n=1 Tax=unclassified Enterococcus TaxID=2608891 RepID=UPI003D2FB39C